MVIAFIAYSFGIRHQDKPTVALITKKSGSTNTTQPTTATPAPATTSANTSTYKDGTYTGDAADAVYGNIQVQVTISGGKITDVTFLQHPNDRQTSIEINQQAMPLLRQEALQAQSAQVDGVTGATDSSMAFVQSLTSALSKA